MSDKSALLAILARSGDPVTVAWVHDGMGDLASLPDPLLAIEAAGELGKVELLQGVSGPKPWRKAAAAALHRIKSRGVKVTEVVAPRSFALGKESVEVPSRAFLSMPDFDGDVELLLTCTDDEGTCALGLVVGGSGVKDAGHGHLSRGELRDMWKQVESRPEMAEVPFTTALHYADAWLTPVNHRDWKHFLEHVAPATLASARVLDPVARAPAPPAGGEADTRGWMAPFSLLDESALMSAMDEAEGTILSPIELAPDQIETRMETLARDVADRALTDRNRGSFVRCAELAATSFRFHGRTAAADAAKAAARDLEAGKPGREIAPIVDAVRAALVLRHLQQRQEPEEATP